MSLRSLDLVRVNKVVAHRPGLLSLSISVCGSERIERGIRANVGVQTYFGVPAMSLATILLIVLVLLLVGVVPSWPHSRGWGYGPSGIVGVVLVVLLILFLTGRI